MYVCSLCILVQMTHRAQFVHQTEVPECKKSWRAYYASPLIGIWLTDLPKYKRANGPLPPGSAGPALEFFFFSGLDPIVFPEGKPTRFFSKESNYVKDMKPSWYVLLYQTRHFRSFFLPHNGLKRPEKKIHHYKRHQLINYPFLTHTPPGGHEIQP